MDDDDFRDLIRLVQREVIALGAPDLADERNYAQEFGEGEQVQLPPQKLLIAMLDAFDRHMALRDHATYDAAMKSITNTLRFADAPQSVLVEQVRSAPPAASTPDVNLNDAPDLSSVRGELQTLIGALLEVPRGAAP